MPMKKLLFKKYTKGFTLIELLVVIAIIGILTAIITANLTGAKSKARDAKRISDLAQIQLTLEQVFDRCGKYQLNIYDDNENVCTGTNFDGNSVTYNMKYFISAVPTYYGVYYDYYVRRTNGTIVDGDYVLKAGLENDNVARKDMPTLDSNGNTSSQINVSGGCGSNNVNLFYYCVSPK